MEVAPQLHSSGNWLVDVLEGDDTVEIVLPPKHFSVIKDRKLKSSLTLGALHPTIGGNNRSSVQVALESLCVEIQSAVTIRSASANKKVNIVAELRSFDENADGNVSKHELVVGCRKLGIEVTLQAVDLMWPLFTPDPVNGNVHLDSFMSTLSK
jgi:hypothetical protein